MKNIVLASTNPHIAYQRPNIICKKPNIIIDSIPKTIDAKQKAQVISSETGIPIQFIYDNSYGEQLVYNLSNQWLKINKSWFYLKNILDDVEFINELLGQEISLYFNLETIIYKTIQINSKNNPCIHLISKNFFDKDHRYFQASFLNLQAKKSNLDAILANIKQICYKYNDQNKLLLKDIIKMSVRDLYSGYIDRHELNFFFKEENNKIRLAPLLDYANSFIGNPQLYENTILKIDANNKNTINIIKNCPIFQENIEKALDINMNKLLKIIEEKYSLKLSHELKYFFLKSDKNNKTLIKNLYLKK